MREGGALGATNPLSSRAESRDLVCISMDRWGNFLRCAFIASSDSIDSMATLTIRQLDEKTKTRLRVRAAHHGRSMEEEARAILRSALTTSSPAKGNLAETIHRRFAALGGLELELPRRDPIRRAAEFGE